mmetsp:Transcript_3719/g.10196  ORF Transcript_3719/g.10196 Transcript_3719/m.10196 type:complete len:117 (-) Transcript_3719:34-384(-)
MGGKAEPEEEVGEKEEIAKGARGEQARGMQALEGGDNESDMDVASVKKAMSMIQKDSGEAKALEAARKARLAKVEVNKEDVQVILSQFDDLTTERADEVLREHDGDLRRTLLALCE